MVGLTELVDYADRLLDAGSFHDYCPNGLQVGGRPEVRRLVSGVTACRALIEAAIDEDADAVLVHHGYFWKGEDARITGLKRERLRLLLAHDIGLIAYHLPLDAHPELGNNAGLAAALGWRREGGLGPDGLGSFGVLADPVDAMMLATALGKALGRPPLHVAGGPEIIQRIGWCSGAAQDRIEDAAALGLDAFVSGEISERTVHIAREARIHYFAAGHHATERFGPRALGAHLALHFGVEHRFIDIENPV